MMDRPENEKKPQKVAIVHDFLLYPGGAEKVLLALAKEYPDAPIYTLLYDEQKMGDQFGDREIRTSFLQKWPSFFRKRYKFLLPFFGTAVESFDLRDFDLVLSSSGAWSKGLVTRLYTKHVAYVHSPMRYVWDENEKYMRRSVKRPRFFVRYILSYLRVWDFQAAQRPDVLVANSLYTQQRIEKYYRSDSHVVYPPVVVPENILSLENESEEERPFVIISRLVDYKNVHVAIDVCNKLQLSLVVVGDGPMLEDLKSRAGETVEVKGWCSEDEKWRILSNGRGLLFPTEDDFGIVCVEALAAGIPVIGLNKGGVPEVVEHGVHGILFDYPTPEVMADGIRKFLDSESGFSSVALRERARIFSEDTFRVKYREILAKIYE